MSKRYVHPKTLFVRASEDSDGSVMFEAYDKLTSFDESGPVAVYKLEVVEELNISRRLGPKQK